MARKPQPPTRVILVRHATTTTTGKVLPGRAPGLHLSDLGREQARTTAAILANLPAIDALYTSPLERARETAAEIVAATGVRPVIDRGLIECDFGTWTGKELATLRKQRDWDAVQRHPASFRFPDGESFLEMSTRIVTCLQSLRALHQGKTIVAVSHADPIKAALADALGLHLDQFQRLSVSPASMSVVLEFPDGATLVPTVSSLGPLDQTTGLQSPKSAQYNTVDEVDPDTAKKQ